MALTELASRGVTDRLRPMDPKVRRLYEQAPTLPRAYVRDVLKLTGEQAQKVAQISGGIHEEEAALLARVTAELDPVCSLEIGLGYGFSAMTICTAGRRDVRERRHIVIDPHQSRYWNREGMRHLADAGFGDLALLSRSCPNATLR